jgi:predicted transcriptional regulator of viral defense system
MQTSTLGKQLDKEYFQKALVNIILNAEWLEPFLLLLERKQNASLTTALNILVEVLANTIRQKKKRKKNDSKRNVLLMPTDDIIVYIENPT